MDITGKETLRRAVHYLFALVTLAYLISGLGITEYRAIEPLTGGMLTKALSFTIHGMLLVPFVLLLALHIYLVLTIRSDRDKKRN
ncbi:MAG: hypothetical protein PHV13_01005 [Candidatus ainarchaeum sp.]|nr:hypothetical protein [Candidatus ainarchaeum sp.]